MATVPIEIILQDAETPVDPTPTPESGEETNIVVPSTGTISNDGNSNGGIGSTISIILPIVIAVLALGAMVALLVRRQQKRKNNINANMSKKEKFFVATSGTIAILAATVLVGNLVIPATKATSDESNSDNSSEESTYLETEDKITITAIIDKDSEEDTYTVSTKDILYATTDASGYTVTMSMVQGALTSNLYLDGNTESEYYIASVEEAELTNNTWGYALNEETEEYLPVPLADTPVTIKEGEEAVTHEEIDVYYTVKVNKELPLGTYTGTIEYNITPVNPIDKLTYMQDFASFSEEDKTKLLASMPEGEQYILKDKRDEKPYYISKLADGNVWMTQNLDLDIINGKTYTSSDTDLKYSNISDEWTPSIADEWVKSNTEPSFYSPGNRYWDGVIKNPGGNIDNSTVADPSTIHNGEHYHIGNYYNWTAAVAMNDSSSYTTQFQDVNQSICPAGWRLPTYEGNKSYQNLVSAQNLTAGTNGNIQNAPAYFIYGGYWLYISSSLIGNSGQYWTSVVRASEAACKLDFDFNGTIQPQNANYNNIGYPIRCLAR